MENHSGPERPVLDLVLDALPATLALGSLSILLALVISIPIGTLAAARPGSWLDKGILVVAMIGQSLPNFWIGVMLDSLSRSAFNGSLRSAIRLRRRTSYLSSQFPRF